MLPLALVLSKEKRLNVTSWEHPAVLARAVPAEQRCNHGVREAAEGPRAGGARLPCDPTAAEGGGGERWEGRGVWTLLPLRPLQTGVMTHPSHHLGPPLRNTTSLYPAHPRVLLTTSIPLFSAF